MPGPCEKSNDPPKGDREAVPEKKGDKIAAEEEQMLSGPQHNDQSESNCNAVATPENENPKHGDADNDHPPPSPASSEHEAAILEQMMRDLGSHRVNDLALDDDKGRNTNGSSFFNPKSKPAAVASKATLPVANHGDDDKDDDIAGAYNTPAAENHEKCDARLVGLNEIDGNEYRAGLQRQLAAEKGADASRKANRLAGNKETYSHKRGGSPSHRGTGSFGVSKSSLLMKYSPRRRRSASPSAFFRRSSFGGSEQGKSPPPARPTPLQFSEEQLAAAREMQTMFREPKGLRGRSKPFTIRGNVSEHGGPLSRVSRSPKKFDPSPFQTASKALSATKPASVSSDPIRVVLPPDRKSAAGHPPVPTKFDNSWVQKATAAVRSTTNPSKASSFAPLQRRSPAPSSAGTVHPQSAQCISSGSSHGTDLVVQTIPIKKEEPEEWDDIYDVSPRSRYVPRRDTRSAPLVRDDLVSMRGSSERGACLRVASARGAARDLRELDDEMFWASHPSIPQSDIPSAIQVDGGEDAAIIATAAEHDISSCGPSGDSGMLMDFHSPARISAPQAVPAIDPSARRGNIFEFVMSRSLMDKSFGMDNSFEGEGSVDASADQMSSDVEAVVSDEIQQQSQSTSGGAPTQASGRPIVYQVDQMRDLRHHTHPELVKTIAANIPSEVRPFPALVTRQRAQTPVHQQESPRQVTKRDPRCHQPRPTLTTPVANQLTSTQIQEHIRELRSRIDTFDYQLVHHRMDETQMKAVRKQHNRALQQTEGYERYMRGTKALTIHPFSPKVFNSEQSHDYKPRTNTTKVKPVFGGMDILAATGARNASGQGGLAASKWASPEKSTATDTETLPRRLAGLDGDGGEVLGELVKTKKLGGLADSKYADDTADDIKSKKPSRKPQAPIRATPPEMPTRAGRGRGIFSFAQYTESERSRRDASTRGSNRGRGIRARGDMVSPGRSTVADENVSSFKGRSGRRGYCFDGANDDFSTPPSCRRPEPSSPLKSPARSKTQVGDDSQDPVVVPAFVDSDLPALSDTTNRNRANSIIASHAGSPTRTPAARVNAGLEVSPVGWEQTHLADAHASAASAREQAPETEPTPSHSSDFRTHTSSLGAMSGEFRRPPASDAAASTFFLLAGYATRAPWAIPQMPASVHQQAEPRDVHNDRYDPDYGSDDTYGPMFGYVPPPQLMPVALLASGPAQGLGPLLMSSNPQSQSRMLTGHAYLPDTNSPGQVRPVRCLVRGAPWVDPQTATVKANIIFRADDGEYMETVGSLNGPPSDTLGNRWFADLFAAVENLAQDCFFARYNTQPAPTNQQTI